MAKIDRIHLIKHLPFLWKSKLIHSALKIIFFQIWAYDFLLLTLVFQWVFTMTVILSTSCRSNQDDKEEKSTKPTRAEFLVSFLVDARGGSMTGCRSTQLRMLIPPRAAEQPVRITCRQLRSDNVLHLPPLNDGEGLASRILQLTPCQFLTPILLELRYSTHDTSDREIVIYRSDSGKKWTLHTNCGSDENLNAFMSTSVYDLSKINPSEDFKIQEIYQFF